jgi:hypothetical protein
MSILVTWHATALELFYSPIPLILQEQEIMGVEEIAVSQL